MFFFLEMTSPLKQDDIEEAQEAVEKVNQVYEAFATRRPETKKN